MLDKEKTMFDFNLQLFAEDVEGVEEESSEKSEEAIESKEKEAEEVEGKTYTEDELQKIIKDRLARAEKAKERAIAEAEKLAKMNAEEKKEYEYKKMQEELEELKRKDVKYELSREASKMLAEEGIVADEELLNIIVRDDAETTKASVSSFIEVLNKKVEEGVSKALTGKSPKRIVGNNRVTKKEIMEIKNPEKRLQAIRENSELFK